MRSLNVSVAAALALGEAMRQIGRAEREPQQDDDAISRNAQRATSAWFEDCRLKKSSPLSKSLRRKAGPFAPDAEAPGRFAV